MRLFAPWLDRDDYAQEAAVARWQGAHVNRRLIDVTRGASRLKHCVVSHAAELDNDLHAGRDDTLETVLDRERMRETIASLHRLAPRQRACLLRAVRGESVAEIAAAEGLTWKQAENALSWARKTLRDRALAEASP